MNINIKEQFDKLGYVVFDVQADTNFESNYISHSFNVFCICHQGHFSGEINMHEVKMKAGDRMFIHHNMLMRTIEHSDDLRITVLLMSDEFVMESIVGIDTEVLEPVMRKTVAPIENVDEKIFIINTLENLRIMQRINLDRFHKHVSHGVMHTLMCVICELERGKHVVTGNSYSMADIYFRNFIGLIYKHGNREHEVNFYASKLNITSKYLNEITKQKSKHKAKEVISGILVTNIKREILISGKSLKTIAYEYNFADQSSLGKFFHKETGMSPSTFKKVNSSNFKSGIVIED